MKPAEDRPLDFLSNQKVTFYIPPYQRNYEWDEKTCKVFFDDIISTAKENISEEETDHFFGTITFYEDSEREKDDSLKQYILIDGQQRITTIMLFLMAYRDIMDDDYARRDIQEDYIINRRRSDDLQYKIKLKQVESDSPIYEKLVREQELNVQEKKSNIYKNYAFFKSNLEKIKAEETDFFRNIVHSGLKNFTIITLKLEPRKNKGENPQEIFESMNSIGKPLSLADLVRNYLLLGLSINKQEELYNKYWLNIEKNLHGEISNFIRDYMQMVRCTDFKKASEANHKELYANFKSVFGNENAETILSNLSSYSVIYAYIVFEETTGNKKVDKAIANIRATKATTCFSFVLDLLSRWKNGEFSDDEIVEILDVIFVFLLRRRIISLTGPENKTFPRLSEKVQSLLDAENKKEKMLNIFSEGEYNFRMPNDVEVKRTLKEMNFFNFVYGKFILSLVEEKLTNSRPDLKDKNLQVEHIMPQTLTREWEKYLGKDFNDIYNNYLNNIGNLTLIRHNQKLSNKAFDYKKSVYENNAGLQIAKTKITDVDKWGEKSIIDRRDWIVDYIVDEVISLPEDLKKKNNYSVRGKGLSFNDLQLIGEEITFIKDNSIKAKVVGDKEVEFEGKKWRLSPLTRELFTRMNMVNKSGAYQGSNYWEFDGMKLADII